MERMVGDLLDLTRSRLGGGIPIQRDSMDAEMMVRDVVSELTTVHPQGRVDVDVRGDVRGRWDEERLAQVMANLIGNALEHGAADAPVSVSLKGLEDEVTIAVHNQGEPIPPGLIARIFDPMKRRQTGIGLAPGVSPHLGLGLYIAERVVSAHGGTIDVASSASEGTTFTVHLPREV